MANRCVLKNDFAFVIVAASGRVRSGFLVGVRLTRGSADHGAIRALRTNVNRERRRLNDRGRHATSVVVGLDLVRVSAIVESIAEFGNRFLDRVFTTAELQYCFRDQASAPMRLAARFAAKEAVLKVLRLNDEAIPWRSIEVTRAIGGACDILLADPARARASDAGFIGFSLSMTHEEDYAGAIVIGERRRGARAP